MTQRFQYRLRRGYVQMMARYNAEMNLGPSPLRSYGAMGIGGGSEVRLGIQSTGLAPPALGDRCGCFV
jgi:hypothetical protein